ncbi:uncharacterized protein PAC_17714 [Phialocephala subalpina]|uniref:Heterokaryon incompatibility domain-containing protein n=1 Tax=Phialocephala subalpina TaxID=576137 RepID=A0A1L7XS37_9HELO|nr:uncharacterized protein PAC_17714 [Phialocephala subalpina]
MSSLCPASSSMLILRDEDLHKLRFGRPLSLEDNVSRDIDIKLSCNLSPNLPGSSNPKLYVMEWENGKTQLCGACSFCDLLADSMQQSLNACVIGSKLDPTLHSHPLGLEATMHFDKLMYRRERRIGLDIIEEGLSNQEGWDFHTLHLIGKGLIKPKDAAPDGKFKQLDLWLAFDLFGEYDDTAVNLLKVRRRPLCDSRLSDKNVAKISDWIRECDESHGRRCRTNSNIEGNERGSKVIPFRPIRLIDVGDGLHDEHPRLVITSAIHNASPNEVGKYMALSYCWGPVDKTSKLLTTTHDTIGLRSEKIVFSTMPQTFQDAVNVARKLGIQYLWIDSLCIIQDDAQDWQIESSKMAEIFSNAHLTIIAATGSSCNDGFLTQRSGPYCMVPLSIEGAASEGQLSLRFRPHWGRSDKMAEIVDGRWITRGWTFQEERLARRALIFGKNKLFFNCRALERSEDTEMSVFRPRWVLAVTEGPTDRLLDPKDAASLGRWNDWQTLCTHYTFRELTFPSDKLPAISGIASKTAKKVESEYLAGLWKTNIVHDLFWATKGVATKPKNYRAPSWSWASLDGRIVWPYWQHDSKCAECIMRCTVLDVRTAPSGLDPYGAVKDGVLKVQGALAEMKVAWVSYDGFQHTWRLIQEGKYIGRANVDIESEELKIGGQATYQALLVALCTLSEDSNSGLTRGLLLEKNGRKRGDDDEFERVGTFDLYDDAPQGIWESHAEGTIVII